MGASVLKYCCVILIMDIVTVTLLLLLASFSFPTGYFLGVYTEDEISKFSSKIHADKIFGIYLVSIEMAVLVLLSLFVQESYFLITLIIIMLFDLIFSAFYSVLKYDFIRLITYQILFFGVTEFILIIQAL